MDYTKELHNEMIAWFEENLDKWNRDMESFIFAVDESEIPNYALDYCKKENEMLTLLEGESFSDNDYYE